MTQQLSQQTQRQHPDIMMSSQHYNKQSYYATNNMNVSAAPPTSGFGMTGMGNQAFTQSVNDAYRYANVHQQQQPSHQRQFQDYAKPANPPLKMLVPSDMVGAIIGAFTLCIMIKGKFVICRFDSQNLTVIDVHERDVGCISFSS